MEKKDSCPFINLMPCGGNRIFFLIIILSVLYGNTFVSGEAIDKEQTAVNVTSRTVDSSAYIIYIPSGVSEQKKYPLVIALSPNADAHSMIGIWRSVSEKYKWIIFASKEHRNGMDMKKTSDDLANALKSLSGNYPIDKSKVIVTGFSGGAMSSHAFSMFYPRLISAVVINTGMIHEYYAVDKKYPYPTNKIAVFLASPTDFRYNEMKRDRKFLEGLGWKTKWIEFEGGHTVASQAAYDEAAKWLAVQFE